MSFKFLHTSDWHIGRRYSANYGALATRLTQARLDVIDRIAQLAMKNDIEHILVAGDVWDDERPSDQLLTYALETMAKSSNVTWWLMPGNHDPCRGSSLWTRISIIAPPNVRLLLEPKPYKVSKLVWLLPAPFNCKYPVQDRTSWMNQAEIPHEAIKIGVAHGNAHGTTYDELTSTSGYSTSTIDPDRAFIAGLDYLALGDTHSTEPINERTWYCGTPEPDKFLKNSSGQAIIVNAAKTTPPTIRKERVSIFDWQRIEIGFNLNSKSAQQLDELESQSYLRYSLIRLALSGSITYKLYDKIDSQINVLRKRTAWIDINISELKMSSSKEYNQENTNDVISKLLSKLKEGRNNSKFSDKDRLVAEEAIKIIKEIPYN